MNRLHDPRRRATLFTVAQIGLSFLAVFVGAFLAVGLENMRERWRTRRWVRGHIRQFSARLAGEMPKFQKLETIIDDRLAAYDRWRTAENSDDMDEATWDNLTPNVRTIAIDFGHLLRTDSLTVLPGEVADAFDNFEAELRSWKLVVDRQWDAFEPEIAHLWYERVVPLRDADCRRLARYRQEVEDLRVQLDVLTTSLERLVAILADT